MVRMDPDAESRSTVARAGEWGDRWSAERRAVGRLVILLAVVVAAFAAYRWINASYEARRGPRGAASANAGAAATHAGGASNPGAAPRSRGSR
jgi:uncharacterized membrane protein YidH (DUF202 family)